MPLNQPGTRFSVLAMLYAPALAVLALAALVSVYAAIPIGFFVRDPAVTLGGHPLTGAQSHLGVLVWCAAAAACLVSSASLRRTQIDKERASFLLWFGVITAALLLDDLFLFHENLAHRYLRLNEETIFAAYGLGVAVCAARFRRTIRRSPYPLLLLALVFLGVSLSIDFFQDRWQSPWRVGFEDGFKFLGIVSWSGYLILTCVHTMSAALTRRPDNQ